MNLEVLEFLKDNDHYITEQAQGNQLDDAPAKGITQLLLGNNGEISVLSSNQQHHYRLVLQPLLESVRCDGAVGLVDIDSGESQSSCCNGGIIDDESLLQSYQEDSFMCQTCRYDAENM